jgi:hypothetical protein
MVATNMAQLEKMLLSQAKKAMNVAAEKMKADVMEETYSFYTGSNPTMYIRTGALGDTPRVTAISCSGKTVSFDVSLDTSFKYSTGDNPSMEQVLLLADKGIPWTTQSGALARQTVGRGGFWERSENKFKKTLDSVMASFFRKL